MKKHLQDISRYQTKVDRDKYDIFLGQNERNTYLPEEVFDNFLSYIEQTDIFQYPDLNYLYSMVAGLYKVSEENILLTNGSDSAIKTIFEAFELKGKNIVTTDYCFPMYKVYSNLYQAAISFAEYTDMTIDVNTILDATNEDTQFIIISNPNSPLGDYQSIENIKKLLDTGIHVVVDEAYIESTDKESCVSLIKEYNNLSVLRTFSKAYGAAGMRVGTLLSSNNNITNYFSKLRLAYPLNSFAVKYIEFILDHHSFFLNYFDKLKIGKKNLVEILEGKGVELIDTDSSWFFIKRTQNDKDLLQELENQRIHVRVNSLPGQVGDWIKLNYEPILENYDFNFS
jgi:histidinol-phosphate aminotransferase